MSLPAERFVSMGDYLAWRAQHEATLAWRAAVERESAPVRPGSCAPCLRAASLDCGVCDCEERLDPQERALLHAALDAGLCRWSRLWLDVPRALAARLLALVPAAPVDGGARVEARPVDLAITTSLPPVVAALAGMRRRLVSGGRLLAAIPFAPETWRTDGDVFGWELLGALSDAGFGRAAILCPWSRELGYFGATTIVEATA